MTHYKKLKLLPNAEKYLKKEISFSELEEIAMADLGSPKQTHEQ